MLKLPPVRPAELTVTVQTGSPRHERLSVRLSGGTAEIVRRSQGAEMGRAAVSLSAVDFDALYAVIVDGDLGRLLERPFGPMVHDHDGPSLEVLWHGGRLWLNESGFEFNDARFSAVVRHLEGWARAQWPTAS